ncbi:DNA polymerase domain-containing protein [Desulfuribacillus stibiiarsenatis]|uniref:DNA polymerase domain-containing protein n=1 Tax=Desulfuribacillus stibiiarsenatis TaxID=1390249 RepID=A0A1E5L6N9_9FIRM|nr:non-homologous end-joining DNA ligase [Desulfuribacillus stibiiarsenatis]OEH85805.1 DNA polymerase domain-containing protein [Desulfuribacillus stibiiarsenatis]
MDYQLTINNKIIKITNPNKVLWPKDQVTKLQYVSYIMKMADYILTYSKHRYLTTIRYPDGVEGKNFYQKNIPTHAPEWIESKVWNGTNYILPNEKETLVWLANLACLELHVSFNTWKKDDFPTELVFDLDPTDVTRFEHVLELALHLRDILLQLGLTSYPKTSGASGLQVYVPIQPKYPYELTRQIGKFIAEYMQHMYPKDITVERLVKMRGNKLYVDYLQHWRGKTLPAPYSVRAKETPNVSTPVTWKEVEKGFIPSDFTIFNVPNRCEKYGDLFHWKERQSLDIILDFLNKERIDT